MNYSVILMEFKGLCKWTHFISHNVGIKQGLCLDAVIYLSFHCWGLIYRVVPDILIPLKSFKLIVYSFPCLFLSFCMNLYPE